MGDPRRRRPRAPRRRLILLGASNVSYGLATIVDLARRTWATPLEILTAHGHGRSYGRESWVLGRGLSAILESRLWEAVAALPTRPTTALVTDIGNDLLYDIDPARLAAWVEKCFERLRDRVDRMVVTELPLAAIGELSDWWFWLLRTVQFPRCRLDRATVVGRAHEVNALVLQAARKHGVEAIRPRPEWYGVDPIHIRAVAWPQAWREILSPLLYGAAGEPLAPQSHHAAYGDWLHFHNLAPAEWKYGNRRICSPQPACKLIDGTTVALY